jgi:hypothetical protein
MLKKLGCCCGLALLVLIAAGYWGVNQARQLIGKPKPADPRIGRYVALRPVFIQPDGETFSAGTAVAARTEPGRAPILLTALHLLGPAGGLERDTPPADIGKVVRGVALVPFGAEKPVAIARGALRKGGRTLPADDLDEVNDLAVFALPKGARVNALPLAAESPAFGDWVWLVGDVFDHEPQTQRLFPGRIVARPTGGALRVLFRPAFELRAFSGAPLINARGELVGLLIGGAEGIASANPVEAIRARLAESGIR